MIGRAWLEKDYCSLLRAERRARGRLGHGKMVLSWCNHGPRLHREDHVIVEPVLMGTLRDSLLVRVGLLGAAPA